MSVTIVEYKKMNPKDKERIAEKLVQGSLYQQLWYVAALTNNQFYILNYGEEEALLLVPFGKKKGIRYAYRPLFLQQIPFFGDESKYEELIIALQQKLRFGDISLSQLQGEEQFNTVRTRTNFVLPLNKSYEALRQNFRKNHKRNINKSQDLVVKEVDEVKSLCAIFEKEKQHSFSSNELKSITDTLFSLTNNSEIKPYLKIVNAYENDVVVGSFLLIHFNNRIFYLLGTSIKGSETLSDKALYKLFDDLIQKNAGTNTVLDFEGSDIPGVARFFAGFGAEKKTYYNVKWNKLPFPFRILKR